MIMPLQQAHGIHHCLAINQPAGMGCVIDTDIEGEMLTFVLTIAAPERGEGIEGVEAPTKSSWSLHRGCKSSRETKDTKMRRIQSIGSD